MGKLTLKLHQLQEILQSGSVSPDLKIANGLLTARRYRACMIRRVLLFGGLRVVSESEVAAAFRTRNSARLLSQLALAAPGSCVRDAISASLWEGEAASVRRARLRYELSLVRRMLGEGGLVKSSLPDGVALAPDVLTDIGQFWRLAEAGLSGRESCRDAALALSDPGLLPGWNEPWVVEERVRVGFERERLLALQDS